MNTELLQLTHTINRVLAQSGVKISETEVDGHQVCRAFIPTSPRPIILTARMALPGEVGKVFGKNSKFRNAAKKVAKKVVKSKVLKKMVKVIGPLSSVIPGMQPIAAGLAAAAAAKKIVSAARGGNPKAKKFAANAIKKLNTDLRHTAARFTVTAPGGGSSSVSF